MCSIQTKRQDIYIYKKFSCKQKTYSDIYFFLNRIRQKYLLTGQITWTNTLKIESIHIQRRTWKIFNIISLFIRTIQIISNSWELLELQKWLIIPSVGKIWSHWAFYTSPVGTQYETVTLERPFISFLQS